MDLPKHTLQRNRPIILHRGRYSIIVIENKKVIIKIKKVIIEIKK